MIPSSSQTADISIIIVDFLKADQVVKNVDFLLRQKGEQKKEIIILDNSCDVENQKKLEVLQEKKEITLLFPSKNMGYSAGNNYAAKQATGKILLFLNPDITCSDENIFSSLVSVLEDEKIGIVGVPQKNPDKSYEPVVRQFPSLGAQIARRTFLRKIPPFSSWVKKYEMLDFNFSQTQEVPWLQSSFFALRREVWEKLGGFDERYFLFMADTQMCLDVQRQGKKILFFSERGVLADGKRCSHGGFFDVFRRKVLRIHIIDAVLYWIKNH